MLNHRDTDEFHARRALARSASEIHTESRGVLTCLLPRSLKQKLWNA